MLQLIFLVISCRHSPSQTQAEGSSAPISGNKAQTVYAPLLFSQDSGLTWQPATQDLPTDLQVSFLEPKGDKLVLASDNHGIFLSEADHSQWQAIGDALPTPKINALHVSGEAIYAGVYRAGIYRSVDEGKTWESLNYDLPNLHVQSILKLNTQVLAGTDAGVFMLEEHTRSWTLTPLSAQVLSLYQYKGKLIAGTNQGTALSVDQGKSWQWIRQAGAVHYTRGLGKRVVELAINGDLVYSDDWGQTWLTALYEPKEGSYVYDLIKSGSDQLISNNYGIHRSSDKGKTWQLIYATESMAFFNLLSSNGVIYGGMRSWDEYRERSR